MQPHLYQLNRVYSLLQSDKVKEAAELFAQALKEIYSFYQVTNLSFTVDFAALEALFRIDLALCKVNRECFWKAVGAIPNLQVPKELQDVELFIKECVKNIPASDDLKRVSQLRSLIKENRELPGLQYLLALALAGDEATNINQAEVKESLGIFAHLASLSSGGDAEVGTGNQSQVFCHTRIIAVLQYTRTLTPKQALDFIDGELKAGWTEDARYLHDHLITRRESLSDAVSLTAKMEKTFDELGQSYQMKHIEIVAIFFGLIALVVGTIQLIPSQKTLFEALSLLGGLSLALIAVLGIVLGLLASKKSLARMRFGVGIVSLFLFGIMVYFSGESKAISAFERESVVNLNIKYQEDIDVPNNPNSSTVLESDGESEPPDEFKTNSVL